MATIRGASSPRKHEKIDSDAPTNVDDMRVEWLVPSTIRRYPNNPRTNKRAVKAVRRSLDAYGWRQPIVVDRDMVIVVGDTRYLAAVSDPPMARVPVHIAWDMTPDQARAYRIADNKTHELAGWDNEALREEMSKLEGRLDLKMTGFSTRELESLLAKSESKKNGNGASREDDESVIGRKEPRIRKGEVWELGDHRLMCGDCTSRDDVATLLGGVKVDLLLIDPPYCSGGLQEMGKYGGSVGTSSDHEPVKNDRLSTRGYQALLRAGIGNVGATFALCFTDWRMWVHLFDIFESSSYMVRSMVVWDKGTPGMGRGWRAQHELVMWGARETPKYPKHYPAVGNVIQCPRTGNKHHTTKKPVPLLVQLLQNSPFAETVADCFAGSGSTILAAEQLGRPCFALEMDERYCETAIARWENHTGKIATKAS